MWLPAPTREQEFYFHSSPRLLPFPYWYAVKAFFSNGVAIQGPGCGWADRSGEVCFMINTFHVDVAIICHL